MERFGRFLAALCLLLGLNLHAVLPPTVLDAAMFLNCDGPSRLAVDKDGNRYVAVTYTNVASLGGGWFSLLVSAGAHDVAVAKFNAEGRLIWVRSGGGSGEDGARASRSASTAESVCWAPSREPRASAKERW